MWPNVAENRDKRPRKSISTSSLKTTVFPPTPFLCAGSFSVTGEVVPRLHTADSGGAPRAEEPAHISLDCMSERLLDKDHNMTLFLFCAGSVNRGKAPAAQRALVDVIDRKSCTSSAS